MNALLWAAQVALAAVFLFSGCSKAVRPIRELVASGQTGVEDIPLPLVRLAGVSELAGAAALIVPRMVGRLQVLTPMAAVGLGMIMLLAAGVHLQRREYRTVGGNLVLLALCGWVAVGRSAGW